MFQHTAKYDVSLTAHMGNECHLRTVRIVAPAVDPRGHGHFCRALHVTVQVGLYHPRLARSGVQSLRILEGGR